MLFTVDIFDNVGGHTSAQKIITVYKTPTVAPVFTNDNTFATTFNAKGNQIAVGDAGHFVATSSVPIAYSLTGVDADSFDIDTAGTLTFKTAPDFEVPSDDDENNIYNINVVATTGSLSTSKAITVTVVSVIVVDITSTVAAVTNPDAFPQLTATATSTATSEILSYAWTSVDSSGIASGRFTDPTVRDATWTPPIITGADETITLTLTVTGSNDNVASDTHDVIVSATTATGFTITALPTLVAESAFPTNIRFTATLTGGTFPEDRTILVTPLRTGTAAVNTDYTVASSTALTIREGETSITVAIPLTALRDVLDEADGETVIFRSTLQDADGSAAQSGFNPVDTTITILDSTPVIIFTNTPPTTANVVENTNTVGNVGAFAASIPGGTSVTYRTDGADADYFEVDSSGTLRFINAPNYELPRDRALTAVANTNNYIVTVIAISVPGNQTIISPPVTVSVTDVNDAPTITTPTVGAFTATSFTEHVAGTFDIVATDEDIPTQTLTYALAANAFGATITGNTFSWTPREVDGGEAREFTVTVTDSNSPTLSSSVTFTITATEVNISPTGATITTTPIANVITISNPETLTVTATATDADRAEQTLTYTWSVSDGGGTFDSETGATVTWTPPRVRIATPVTLTVTVSDGVTGSTDAIATHTVTVNKDTTIPLFTNLSNTVDAFSVEENQRAVGVAGHFIATVGTGTIDYSLDGTDSALFTLSQSGTLTFNDTPNFEAPTDNGRDGTYNLNVVATVGSVVTTNAITVTLIDVGGEAPGIPSGLTASSKAPTSITLVWQSPTNDGPLISSYELRYTTSVAPAVTTTVTSFGSGTTHTIEDLPPATSYEFSIRAINTDSVSNSPYSTPTVTGTTRSIDSSTFYVVENEEAVGADGQFCSNRQYCQATR